ncbi:response regulator [Aestuariibacter sp. A3R04]|uniref:response regulator n=1 Tax=Aestuariibacter sp. A3R04 TaxID=2841571 RepID=UPI001C0A5AC8|nr:response regulator [Aestuariibacter sp. A3R04]
MSEVIKVLLVEDDEDDYFLTADYLSQCESPSFAVTWVTNGQNAIDAMQTASFDICLLDYILGAENALDVLATFKKAGISVPVVILTGQSDTRVDEMVMRAGAADYLTKSEIETPRFMRTMRYAMVRREMENERIERHKVEQQNKAKDKFLAHLGHELRTPLTSILGYTELLLDEDNPHMKQELSIIHTNGKHLLSLLNDLLDMSRIMANKLELTNKDVNLTAFMTDVHSLMSLAAKDKDLSMTISSTSPVPEMISVDPTRLRQILINLISNAIKFTDAGSVDVSVETLPPANDKSLLRFRVKDTGIGMPPDKLDDIFHPFEQIEDVMRANHGGAGLGLAICRELVSKMGGEIQVESEFGKGSVFSFTIDPGDVSSQSQDYLSLAAPTASSYITRNLHVTGRVLIVDDLRELRRLTGHLVSRCHASVSYAENGAKAVDAVLEAERDNTPFHLVLMDIHMPVMNGIDALKAIRARRCNVAVVAITAASRKGLKESLLNEGFDDVLGKPIDKGDLLQVLDRYLISTPTPVLPSPPDQVNLHTPEPQGAAAKSVLIVEDDSDAAELMKLLVSHLGHRVTVANSGQAALAAARNTQFDVALLDLTLPDASGIELAAKLQMTKTGLETYIVSGREPDPSELKRVSISGTLLKPVSRQDLTLIFS